MNKRVERKAATRAKVLAAARHLFLHQPYEAVTIRAVAAEAGRSTGSIFLTFSGKEELWSVAMGGPPPDTALGDEIALLLAEHPGTTFQLTYGQGGYLLRARTPRDHCVEGADDLASEAVRMARTELGRLD